MSEKTASDAPVWYSAEAASAWADGFNAATEQRCSAVSAEKDEDLTPKRFVDDILSACDPSNWDADRNKGPYFRGLKDAYEAIQELAIEYQTAMYGWSRSGQQANAAPQTAGTESHSPAAMEGEKDTIVNLIHEHVGFEVLLAIESGVLTGVEKAAEAILAELGRRSQAEIAK